MHSEVNPATQARQELIRFLISGFAAVASDLCIYHLLLNFCPHAVAKGISFLCGSSIAYLLNKFWTFKYTTHSWRQLLSFASLYAMTLCLNIGINQLALDLLPWFGAFLAATASSTTANFVGQKYWVFKKTPPDLSPEF